jgi:hypothetical protein
MCGSCMWLVLVAQQGSACRQARPLPNDFASASCTSTLPVSPSPVKVSRHSTTTSAHCGCACCVYVNCWLRVCFFPFLVAKCLQIFAAFLAEAQSPARAARAQTRKTRYVCCPDRKSPVPPPNHHWWFRPQLRHPSLSQCSVARNILSLGSQTGEQLLIGARRLHPRR